MINLDPDFSTTEAAQGGGFETPPPGGYTFRVVDVSDKPSKAGNDMLTLSVDIATGEYKGAFEKFPKMFFQLVNGEHLPYFKALLNNFAASNNPDRMVGVLNGLQFNAQKLKGLLIGGCLRAAEYEKDGEIREGREVWYFCPISEVADIKPPKMKKLARGGSTSSRQAPPLDDDDLPF
jgi:hypothetical protein